MTVEGTENPPSASTEKPKKKAWKDMDQAERALVHKQNMANEAEGKIYEAQKTKEVNDMVTKVANSCPYKSYDHLAYLILLLLPFASVIVGSIYVKWEYCPPESIATAMIVTGVVGTVTTGVAFIYKWQEDRFKRAVAAGDSDPIQPNKSLKIAAVVLAVAQVGLWLWACVITYRLFSTVDYVDTTNIEGYCHEILYKFAFWSLIAGFLMSWLKIGFMCCLGCCGGCYICIATETRTKGTYTPAPAAAPAPAEVESTAIEME